MISTSLACHLDERGNETFDPLGRRLGFLAPLLAQGFGFRDGFLQRSDMGVQSAAFVRFRPLARRMGILLSY